MKFLAEENLVKIDGRTMYRDHIRYLGYSATAVSFRMKGTKAQVELISDPENFPPEGQAWIAVYINEEKEPEIRMPLTKKTQKITIFESDTEKTVTIKVMKYSEPEYAICGVAGFEIEGELLAPPEKKKHQIQVIGDSITCGYGVEGSLEELVHRTETENPTKSYAYLSVQELSAELEIVAWNGKGVVSGYIGEEGAPVKDTSWLVPMLYEYTDAGLEKQYFNKPQEEWERWDPKNLIPELIMINLGTNDSSYTRENPERNAEFAEEYLKFLEVIHEKNPSAGILCMMGIMDKRLSAVIKQTAEQFGNRHPEIPVSYLELPGQSEEEGFGTFWHPTHATNIKAAKTVAEAAKKLMGW